eukprot:TRINITY_DN3150_c0_g1_i3.p1 TRINITY_DN3150_c0_g1~~TRINITY_DN3150_c0_g1_i3.p1  ORF type:complete len:450 (-),score=156.75 TRINITY_DN3150_c0_g1_i3:59-1357(-)
MSEEHPQHHFPTRDGVCPVAGEGLPSRAVNSGQYYHDYLGLDKILSAQKPVSKEKGAEAHEETLFIIIHQVHELWFKQILHEFESIREIFRQPKMPERLMSLICNRLHRVTEIQRILIEQLRVLETMTALDFLEFRNLLSPASGFQSVQFRILENTLGLPVASRVQYQSTSYHNFFSEEHQTPLQKSEREPSLLMLVVRWLERIPFLNYDGFDFWASYKKAVWDMMEKEKRAVEEDPALSDELRSINKKEVDKNYESFQLIFDEVKWNDRLEKGDVRFSYKAIQAALLIYMYKDEPIFHMPFQMLNLFTEIDENLATWRYRHTMMVQRAIGMRVGTGGSSGYHYLRTTVGDRYKVFMDLFQLSSFLIPRKMLPVLPNKMKESMDFMWSTGDMASPSVPHQGAKASGSGPSWPKKENVDADEADNTRHSFFST